MTFTDQRMEVIIANLLRAGVLLSAAVVLIGGIGYLTHHAHDIADYHQFRGEPAQYRKIDQIGQAALDRDWPAVIQLGLLLLIATPVARVAFSILGFASEKDWTYVVVTTIVLAILLYSIVGQH